MALFDKYAPMKAQVIDYLNKCINVFEETGNTIAARNAKTFIQDFDKLRYNIAIVGSLKRGKSTLLNTLMGRSNDDISPIAFEVCTSAIIKYLDKELATGEEKKEKAVIYFDESQPPIDIPLNRLKNYVTESENPKNCKKVRGVEVYGDFPQWSKAVTIVDSPGQGAVYNYHDTLLTEYLPNADAIVFLIAADLPLDGSDLALLKELNKKQQRKIFYVITKCDSLDHPEDLKDIENRVFTVMSENNLPCEKVYKISAKPVYNALRKGSSNAEIEELKAKYGIDELEKDLESHILCNSDQNAVLKKRIESILKEANNCCYSFSKTTRAILDKNSFDINALNSERATLQDRNDELRKNVKKSLNKFEREWKSRQAKFERKFSAKSQIIDQNIVSNLEKNGFFKKIGAAFSLRSIVEKEIYAEFTPMLLDLETELSKVVETLDADIQNDVSLFVSRSKGVNILAPTVTAVGTGALAIGVSSGLATAGASVSSALTAVGGYATAVSKSFAAAKAATVSGNGLIPWAWNALFGTGARATAAAAAGTVNTSAGFAISAIISSLSTCAIVGVSIWVGKKIMENGLDTLQGNRVPNFSQKIVQDMENKLQESLDITKISIIEEYTQKIEDMINENNARLEEIEDIFNEVNSPKRIMLEENVKKIEGLIPIGDQLLAELPTFTE